MTHSSKTINKSADTFKGATFEANSNGSMNDSWTYQVQLYGVDY